MFHDYLSFEQPIAELEAKIDELRLVNSDNRISINEEIDNLRIKSERLTEKVYSNLSPWQVSQVARHPLRPYTLDYIRHIFTDFEELHGDRAFGDDQSLIGGLANLESTPVMLIGHQKGRGTKEKLKHNFGMPRPEGYRKARRLIKLAEKFKLPILTFIDTPGAYPGLEAEERGQGEAIARNILEMTRLKVPIITVIIGEGASGGALGIGVGDTVLMLENTWYSVISPESCSSILWRSWEYKEIAASALKLTAKDMKKMNLVDKVIKEPEGGAHRNQLKTFEVVKTNILTAYGELSKLSSEKLISKRMDKYSNMGVFSS